MLKPGGRLRGARSRSIPHNRLQEGAGQRKREDLLQLKLGRLLELQEGAGQRKRDDLQQLKLGRRGLLELGEGMLEAAMLQV